jgi:ABC-type sugar transport system ATPase subunit
LEPRLILLDVLSNLDAKLAKRCASNSKLIKVGISALYVTHDREGLFISDKSS